MFQGLKIFWGEQMHFYKLTTDKKHKKEQMYAIVNFINQWSIQILFIYRCPISIQSIKTLLWLHSFILAIDSSELSISLI